MLKPIIEYTHDNKAIDNVLKFPIIKQRKAKKVVNNTSGKLAALNRAIFEVYADNPLHCFFLHFMAEGRGEIKTLEWTNVDIFNNTYTISAKHNKIRQEQHYELPKPILEALLALKDNSVGLVFKSLQTGKELYAPKKQLLEIKDVSGVQELTMHYFRHILVSAMGEMSDADTILSASLNIPISIQLINSTLVLVI